VPSVNFTQCTEKLAYRQRAWDSSISLLFATIQARANLKHYSQVPKQENASKQEAVAAVREQMRCACASLRQKGYEIPEDIVPPAEGATAGSLAPASVSSSVMTSEEQQRFLSSIKR
jgi:hypothetical protein